MKKRILALFLLVVLALSLVACGGDPVNPDPGSDSNVPVSSGNTDAESSDSNTSDQGEDTKVEGYDASIEHKFLACDITSHGIVVFDLNKCEGDWQNLTNDSMSVVWEWIPDNDPNLKTTGPGVGIDSAKYRYSPIYEKDVIIACSSNGWVGIIDYEAKTLLWETVIHSGPHSVEMLPNGDLMVASSYDPGELVYFALSADINEPVHSIPSIYCHGVSWDPENECLWVLEDKGVYQAYVQNPGENGKIVRISGSGDTFDKNEGGGHAFAPVAGQPGTYWASSGSQLWQFSVEDEDLINKFSRYNDLTQVSIKGICSFSDGTVVQSVAGLCGSSTQLWSSDGLRIITRELTPGKVQTLKDVVTVVPFNHREFYKIQAFTKEYQP